ncbi:MAG: pseudouridine synthase [Chitinophagaceae bacterium]
MDFNKFTSKKGSVIKEEIRREKKAERKERETAINKKRQEQKLIKRAQKADDPRARKKGAEIPVQKDATGKGKKLVKAVEKTGAKKFVKEEKAGAREKSTPYKNTFSKGKTPAKSVEKTEAPVSNSREDKLETGAGGKMPLNKYIAHGGLCSRRDAAILVKEGKVTVNGTPATEPGMKINDGDVVKVNGKKVTPSRNFVYILLNKPKDYLTTLDDPQGRKTVIDLVKSATDERVYPIGRLDRNTSGVLLLTNDGDLAQTLAHPKFEVKKIYHVGLDKPLTKADFDKIMEGLQLEDGLALVDSLAYADTKDKTQIGIEIHSGKNRIVRRIFEHLKYDVRTLDRVMYAGLTKKNVQRGKWRLLTEKEVRILKFFNAAKMKKDPTRAEAPVKGKKYHGK